MDTSSTGVATTTERQIEDKAHAHASTTRFRRLPWGRLAQVLIVVSLAVVFLATMRDLRGYDFTILPWPFAASLVLAFSTILSLFYAWYRLIVRVSRRSVPLFGALRIFAYSWLGRYVPGRVWSSVGKVYVGAKLGLSVEELTLASVLEQVFSNLAHVVLALFFLFFLFTGDLANPATLVSVSAFSIGAGLLVLQPPVLRGLVNLILRRLGGKSLDQAQFLHNGESALFVLAYVVPLLLYGGSFWLIVVALDSATNASLLHMMGAFTVGSFIGKLAVVLPAGGIGVREAALVVILQPTIGLQPAILASLISRLSLALVDVSFVFLVSAVDRLTAAE